MLSSIGQAIGENAVKGNFLRSAAGLLIFVGLHVGGSRTASAEYAPQYGPADEPAGHVYVFGVHPLHNAQHLFAVYQPLLERLDAAIPDARFKLEASRNYADFERKLRERHFDFALPNPYQTIESLAHGYHVFAKMADDKDFCGIILVRRDSGIHSVGDLRGKSISYPAPTAVAATLLPKWFLYQHGLDVTKDVGSRYVGSQESSIMNAYMGATAAAATWPTPWRAFQVNHPDYAAQLEVAWTTKTLINNSLVARDDVPAALIAKVRAELLATSETAGGRAVLAAIEVSGFEAADDRRFDVVRKFIADYTARLGPIPEAQ